MGNEINNLTLRSMQVNKPVLKPMSELLKLDIPSSPQTNTGNKTFSGNIGGVTLTSPDSLFKRNFQPSRALPNLSLNLFNDNSVNNAKDVSVIEPGISPTNAKALSQYPGKTWLGKLESNGNRDAAIIIPKNADYSKPFEIVYHFHGHNGKLDQILTDKTYGLHDKINDTAKNKNIIIVIPQGPVKEKDFTWFNGKYNEDMQKFQNDINNVIKTKLAPDAKIGSVTLEGHSAGGRPLMNAAKEGKLYADKIDFLDASYGSWASETYNNYSAKNPNVKFNVVYIPGSGTQADALSLKGKNGVSLIQSKVDHSSVPKTFFDI